MLVKLCILEFVVFINYIVIRKKPTTLSSFQVWLLLCRLLSSLNNFNMSTFTEPLIKTAAAGDGDFSFQVFYFIIIFFFSFCLCYDFTNIIFMSEF